MKRILIALSVMLAALTFCPKPADARVVVVFRGPGFYGPGYYWDRADTPITDILTGIAGSGGTATGAIGSACRARVAFASQSPVT
jgi:hypothetical protein